MLQAKLPEHRQYSVHVVQAIGRTLRQHIRKELILFLASEFRDKQREQWKRDRRKKDLLKLFYRHL